MPTPSRDRASAPCRVLLAASRDWTGTARMPEMLARAGLEVSLLHDGATQAAASSHLTAVTTVTGGPAGVAEALATQAVGYDRVIVADEPTIEALVDRANEPWARALLPSTDVGCARDLVDKTRFARRAAEARLPRPRYAVADGRAELARVLARVAPHVVLKGSRGQGGAEVRGASGPASALAGAAEIGTWPLLVEELVPGPVALVAGVFHRGRMVAALVGEKLRSVGPYGPSALLRIRNDRPDVVALAQRVGETFGLDGFASLDVVLSPHRGPVLIEVNPRPVPTLRLGRRAGADMGRVFAGLLQGRVPAEPIVPRRAVVLRQFPQELQRMRLDHGPVAGTVRWAADPRDWWDLPWGDPGLLRAYLR